MKALMKFDSGMGNVGIRETAVPDPKPDEIRIQVKYCSICGTDLHIYADEFPNAPPVIMGHEYCGTVVKVGEAVKNLWSVGDRVVGELHTGACGRCFLCRNGKPHICDSKMALGSKYNGAFAEYLTIPAWLAHRMPRSLSWEVAGVTEPFAIAAHCLAERGAVQPGNTVLISGAAGMGLMATIWASRLGAGRIIVSGCDVDMPQRFSLARALGAARTVNVMGEDIAEVIAEETEGDGVDVWVECSGSGAAIAGGFDLVKKTGKVVMIGLTGPDTISIPWNRISLKELDLVGCFSSPPSSWELALAAEVEESAKLERLVTKILPLEEWEAGFAMMREGKGVKILIEMEGRNV